MRTPASVFPRCSTGIVACQNALARPQGQTPTITAITAAIAPHRPAMAVGARES